MTYLSSATRVALRTAANRWLKDTCKIEVQGHTLSDKGGVVLTWTTVASAIPCRVVTVGNQNSTEAGLVGEQESLTDMYQIACPAGTALAINQRITITSTGLIYNVVRLETALTDEIFAQAIITRQQ